MAREAVDAADLLSVAELTDVRVYETSARLLSDDEKEDREQVAEEFQIWASAAEAYFETRAHLVVTTSDARIVADASAIYTYAEPMLVSQDVAAEFVERVAIMAIYPFIRELVFSSAQRLSVAPPVMGLLRAGQFTANLRAPASK